MTAVFYHLTGINGLHQQEPDGCLMCAKETGGRALAQALAVFNQSSAGRVRVSKVCASVSAYVSLTARFTDKPRRFRSHMLCNFWISLLQK